MVIEFDEEGQLKERNLSKEESEIYCAFLIQEFKSLVAEAEEIRMTVVRHDLKYNTKYSLNLRINDEDDWVDEQ
jgi:hypothetical protein